MSRFIDIVVCMASDNQVYWTFRYSRCAKNSVTRPAAYTYTGNPQSHYLLFTFNGASSPCACIPQTHHLNRSFTCAGGGNWDSLTENRCWYSGEIVIRVVGHTSILLKFNELCSDPFCTVALFRNVRSLEYLDFLKCVCNDVIQLPMTIS